MKISSILRRNRIIGVVLCGALLLSAPASSASGGDVVGGGSLQKLLTAFSLEQNLKVRLKETQDRNIALDLWLDALSDQQREVLLEKAFDALVIPQIAVPKAK